VLILQIIANLKLRLARLCCNDSISSSSGHILLIVASSAGVVLVALKHNCSSTFFCPIGAPFASCGNPFYSFSKKSLFMPDLSGAFMNAS